MLSYFVIVFWLFFFNVGWLISYQDKSTVGRASLERFLFQSFEFGGQVIIHQVQVDCLLVISCKISLPVIQIWSLHFCLAIIVWESIVANSCIWHWHETGLQTGFVFASLFKVWIELLKHWSRLIDFTSSSSQLFVSYLLQDVSFSHPNLVITFLFGNYSVRVNCCK